MLCDMLTAEWKKTQTEASLHKHYYVAQAISKAGKS